MSALRDALRDLPDAVFADLLESDEGYVLVVDLLAPPPRPPRSSRRTAESSSRDAVRRRSPTGSATCARTDRCFSTRNFPSRATRTAAAPTLRWTAGSRNDDPQADRWRLPYDPGRRGRRRRSRRLRGGYAGQSPCLLAVFRGHAALLAADRRLLARPEAVLPVRRGPRGRRRDPARARRYSPRHPAHARPHVHQARADPLDAAGHPPASLHRRVGGAPRRRTAGSVGGVEDRPRR